jgi:predicted outer membrane protein
MMARVRTVLTAAATVLALVALVACGPETGTAPAPAHRASLGAAHQGALALVALGGLAQERGSTAELRDLAGRLAEEARALDTELREIATSAEIVLGDQIGATHQAVLAELEPLTGQEFDDAWTRAVLDLEPRVRADAVAAGASQESLAPLDAIVTQLR